MRVGILSKEEVEELNRQKRRISRPSQERLKFNASAIDLPLGTEYWIMKGSCRAGKDLRVEDIKKYAKNKKPLKIKRGLVLQRGTVYLIKLDCELNLSETDIQGKSTARSSIGRLDVLVRLLADGAEEYDRITPNYVGDLYAEVTPITFNLTVRPGTCLSQLRLFRGPERVVTLTNEELRYEKPLPIVDRTGKEMPAPPPDPHRHGYHFCLDLDPDPLYRFPGFVAKRAVKGSIDPTLEKHYDPQRFWEPVSAPDGYLQLKTNRLYILRSKERLKLPEHLALECQAYTETLGEWRIEYAGFAHPWFGHARPSGTPIIFEVRGHNISTILTDGIPLGIVSFKRMSRPARRPKGKRHYERQELALSSCFKPWPV